MTNKSNLSYGTFYIVAGIMAFFGTTMPIIDMRCMFPDIYISAWTFYLLWVPPSLLVVLGFLKIHRSSRKLSPAWFIASSLAGIIITIVSIIMEAPSIVFTGKGSVQPSFRVGTGGLILLSAFIGTMFLTIFRIIKKVRDKTYKKRIMTNLLDSTAAASFGTGTYWENRYLSKEIQNSKALPEP